MPYLSIPPAQDIQKLSAKALVSFVEFLDAFGEWHPRDFRLPHVDDEEEC